MQTQTIQVVEAMRANGGFASFSQLNAMIDFSEWKTKTPQASVRRIVQENDAFFRIQPGLWALTECKKTVLKKLNLTKNKGNQEKFTHTYYQGLLVEIGNMKGLNTFIPSQDKNNLFIDKPLCKTATMTEIYNFTYPDILSRAKTVDVIWFNERKLPYAFFEVEHTTDIQNSLNKFFELKDYHAQFYIVGPNYKKKQFDSIINRTIFNPIRKRVCFIDYDTLAKQHIKMSELSNIKERI
jgi:hypothetical protein